MNEHRRRADALVVIEEAVRDPGFDCFYVSIGGQRVTGWLTFHEAEVLADRLRLVIAASIEEAVKVADELAACALRDMAVDSEAFHEGWQACAELCEGFLEDIEPPEPPSHDGQNRLIYPSRLRQERNALRGALVDIGALLAKRFDLSRTEKAVAKIVTRTLEGTR